MVFIQEHVCNANLKFQEDKMDGVKMTDPQSGKTVIAKTQEDVIKFHTDCMLSLEKLNKDNPEDEEEKKKRLANNEKMLLEKRIRIERKKYDAITDSMAGANHKTFIKER